MPSAAQLAPASNGSSWRVSRDGAPFAVVAVRHEDGGIVVAADLAAAGAPGAADHRFDTVQAAEAFASDLIASFAYLGCDVARS